MTGKERRGGREGRVMKGGGKLNRKEKGNLVPTVISKSRRLCTWVSRCTPLLVSAVDNQ